MDQRGDAFTEGNYYHIYNRGLDKHPIFFNRANYEHCLRLVQRYKNRYSVTVIAYCLMPNHYHFLVRQDRDIPVYRFINTLFNSYVQAVNRQQNRKGTLFEGRYRYIHVDIDEYIIHLCRYIHLNPVKAKLVSRPEDWEYSNYQEWINLREGELQDRDFIKAYFLSSRDYASFCDDLSNGVGQEAFHQIGRFRLDENE